MKRVLLIPLFLFILSSISGCSNCSTCGNLKLEPEVKKSFNDSILNPEYNYYASMKKSKPLAIVGIHNKYELKSNHWQRVQNPQQKIAEWVAGINSPRYRTSKYSYPYTGYNILAPDGSVAGVWYGSYTRGKIAFPEPGVLELYPPQKLFMLLVRVKTSSLG